MGQSTKEVVINLAEPIVKAKGLDLVDLEYQKEGDNWILRVFIDKREGVSLDDCQEVSSALSEKLDIDDPIKESYLLEVSSPGIDRPLRTEEDFKRFVGKKVDISTYVPVAGKKNLLGELIGLEDEMIKIKIDDEEIEIPQSKVAQTRLAVEI